MFRLRVSSSAFDYRCQAAEDPLPADKATNKDQSMTIASSSGLSDKDIERMVAESEQYAETDKARRNVIEEANKADSVCADTEKGKLLSCSIHSCLTYVYL